MKHNSLMTYHRYLTCREMNRTKFLLQFVEYTNLTWRLRRLCKLKSLCCTSNFPYYSQAQNLSKTQQLLKAATTRHPKSSPFFHKQNKVQSFPLQGSLFLQNIQMETKSEHNSKTHTNTRKVMKSCGSAVEWRGGEFVGERERDSLKMLVENKRMRTEQRICWWVMIELSVVFSWCGWVSKSWLNRLKKYHF